MSKEPMIKLQPGGVAPILSYNVPEGTTYSGRNFIDLQFGESFFVPSVAQPQGLTAKAASGAAAASEEAAAVAAAELPPAEEIAMLGIDPAEVERMERAGKKLNVFRTLYGELTYNFIDAKTPEAAPLASVPTVLGLADESRGPIASMLPPGGTDPDPDPDPDPVSISVDITSPAAGATINGPFGGAKFDVTGTASVDSGLGTIKKVEVMIGSGAYQTATIGSGSWTLPGVTVATAGQLKITAKATHSSGLTSVRQINVTISLAPQPDTTLPSVKITSPSAGQMFPGNGAAVSLKVEGTATDDRVVTKVELSVDSQPFVQADTGNGWANWSKTITLPVGNHTIVARATDGNNNVSTHSMTVSVDTVPPKVAITLPLGNAEITGSQLHGAMVEVAGTSQDESGIGKVALSLNGNPVFVDAQPKAAGDWSNWKGSILIKDPGLHVVSARATDKAGNYTEATVAVKVVIMPEIVSRLKRLIVVETYQLSTYLGNYGAGRTLKTFSLLPGEKTKISIRSYTQSDTTSKSASSILDSFTNESALDFQNSMANEQSDRKAYDESFKYKVSAEAKASWGFGSASINGEVSGGTNGAREEFAKNISNAVQKHAASASSKRDVQVNTSYEEKTTTSSETAIVREIENINVGRTLNFVFRQMNQEFITLLHLTDVRIGFFKVDIVNGVEKPTYREVTLPQLDSLLGEVIVPEKRAFVRKSILHQLMNIFDYKDRHHAFVEDVVMKDGNGNDVPYSNYLRVKKDYASTYKDEATGTEIKVNGIITAANKHVLRTEGIIVEALLGQGNALDTYSEDLQQETIRTKRLANDLAREQLKREEIAQQIATTRDAAAADIYAKLFLDTEEDDKEAEATLAGSHA